MKLVVTYSTSDGYTYSSDHVVPIEYASEEAFLVDFETWANEHKGETFPYCTDGFLGTQLSPEAFFGNEYCEACVIQTLEDWWENNYVARIVEQL